MVNYKDTSYTHFHFIAKRILDYIGVTIGSIILSPFFLLVIIAIKLDSPGKVIFKQKRVGINGTIFEMYKFRSMYEDADENLHKQYIQKYATGNVDISKGAKLKNDHRITRVGKFLRRTSIDEFPQLINVFNGTMTLVGPRPLPVYEVEYFNLWQDERLNIMPGMTGYWQIYGRGAVSFEDQLRYDIHYIRKMSPWMDIKLLFLTFFFVILGKGAK